MLLHKAFEMVCTEPNPNTPVANISTDRWVASQLIMVSNDTLAQYWEDFGHVSFYRRIDLDSFLRV